MENTGITSSSILHRGDPKTSCVATIDLESTMVKEEKGEDATPNDINDNVSVIGANLGEISKENQNKN